MNSGKNGISGTASATQSFTMDALGNMTSVVTDGTTQTRTSNADNQYTAVGSATLTYDANGNLTTDENGQKYVYDAWNRLVKVNNSSNTTIASYSYDGLDRRITQAESGETTTFYYSNQGQILEEYVGSTVVARNVWSPVDGSTLVLRDQSADGGTLDRLYVVQDANSNVTALIEKDNGDSDWGVVERYVYTPYGQMTYLSGSWDTRTASAYGAVYLFQGGRLDQVTGLYHFGMRDESVTLGRWLQEDPIRFGGGQANLYGFVGNNPTIYTDPSGLSRGGGGNQGDLIAGLPPVTQDVAGFTAGSSHQFDTTAIHAAVDSVQNSVGGGLLCRTKFWSYS